MQLKGGKDFVGDDEPSQSEAQSEETEGLEEEKTVEAEGGDEKTTTNEDDDDDDDNVLKKVARGAAIGALVVGVWQSLRQLPCRRLVSPHPE